jgi:AAA domain
LIGSPEIGKSLMSLQFALAAASVGYFG